MHIALLKIILRFILEYLVNFEIQFTISRWYICCVSKFWLCLVRWRLPISSVSGITITFNEFTCCFEFSSVNPWTIKSILFLILCVENYTSKCECTFYQVRWLHSLGAINFQWRLLRALSRSKTFGLNIWSIIWKWR